MIYSLYTLVDITETGQYRSRSDIERLQQQNFDTVMQTIALAGNIENYKSPTLITADIFGNPSVQCWYFEWTMEISDLFATETDPIGQLKELFNFIPYIDDLTEQVPFTPAVFKLGQNIIFDFKQ